MTVKASSYIASIEAAAPALAVQAIIKMPFATRSTWLSWLDRLRLAAFLLCCPGELTRLLEGCAVSLGGRHQATMDLRGGSSADERRARSSPFGGRYWRRHNQRSLVAGRENGRSRDPAPCWIIMSRGEIASISVDHDQTRAITAAAPAISTRTAFFRICHLLVLTSVYSRQKPAWGSLPTHYGADVIVLQA